MSLATVIRLEFSYPGIGVLVGDSLQYLSIATAHGVIMVFFMIMPTIFGGFGNFLLPTQLGVHDVAFPRLNSAAFWFLPGGLIMLCQLICIDRRYQRLNCFNMRQLETILRRQFFTDFLSSGDHHNLTNNSMIALRFKLNHQQDIQPDLFTFYNLGLTKHSGSSHLPLYTNYGTTSLPPLFTGLRNLYLTFAGYCVHALEYSITTYLQHPAVIFLFPTTTSNPYQSLVGGSLFTTYDQLFVFLSNLQSLLASTLRSYQVSFANFMLINNIFTCGPLTFFTQALTT